MNFFGKYIEERVVDRCQRLIESTYSKKMYGMTK